MLIYKFLANFYSNSPGVFLTNYLRKRSTMISSESVPPQMFFRNCFYSFRSSSGSVPQEIFSFKGVFESVPVERILSAISLGILVAILLEISSNTFFVISKEYIFRNSIGNAMFSTILSITALRIYTAVPFWGSYKKYFGKTLGIFLEIHVISLEIPSTISSGYPPAILSAFPSSIYSVIPFEAFYKISFRQSLSKFLKNLALSN